MLHQRSVETLQDYSVMTQKAEVFIFVSKFQKEVSSKKCDNHYVERDDDGEQGILMAMKLLCMIL